MENAPTGPVSIVHVDYPPWVDGVVNWNRRYGTDDEKMRLAIGIARQNVLASTGGPFGAGVFEADTGRLVSVGMNSVVRLNNSTLHAEMLAFMTAQARVGTYSLSSSGLPTHELFTSCEPCAMCLGATLWTGVKRVVCGAAREDVEALGFDEGPVFPASYRYLEDRGVTFVRHVLRAEARGVLQLYQEMSGPIYNR
ncbi:MAG TPA: nucleoside deaminase [Gemmatimonadaceae bacterium]|nr:nucleoside deaminase [Gemmatimonadaceae bacterium]